MGVSTTPKQLSNKLTSLAAEIPQANRKSVEAGALTVKTRVLAKAAGPTGGDLKFSGGGGKVGVRYRIRQRGPSETAAFVRATGPMHWLERGVQPHAVAPKSLGGTRAARTGFVANAFGSGQRSLTFGRSTGALRFADGSYRKWARRAGGFPAKRTWSEGVRESQVPVREVFNATHRRQLLRIFR